MTRGTTTCCSLLLVLVAFTAETRAKDADVPALVPVRPVWTLALNNQITLPPAFDASRAFFFIESDRLAAYEIFSGKQLWLVEARPAVAAAAADDLVFVGETESLVALRVADGSVAWRTPLHEPPTLPLVADNGWLFAASAGAVLAFRASDGELVWRQDVGAKVHAPPAPFGDRIYVSAANSRVVALRLDSGETLWERRVGGSPNEIAAIDERLYVGSTDNFFYCLMADDGRIDWRWRTGADVRGRAVTDQRLVYFVSLDNVLRAMHLKSGGQQWMRALPLRPTSGPALAGASIVVSGQSATIRTYNIKDGSPSSDIGAGGEVAAPPHVVPHPISGMPMLLVVTKDIVKGATAALYVRTIDPELSALLSALPPTTTLGPTPATTTPR